MKIDFDHIDFEHQMLVMQMFQCAILQEDLGGSEREFMQLSKGCWETLELNGEKLRKVVRDWMIGQLEKKVKEAEKETGQ